MTDRQCKMQRGIMIDEAYCLDAQQRDICAGCKYNEGRAVSRFIEKLMEKPVFDDGEHAGKVNRE